jgi:hypothetical protein
MIFNENLHVRLIITLSLYSSFIMNCFRDFFSKKHNIQLSEHHIVEFSD